MPISTVALVIGISHYLDPSIETLPAATSDAIVFARALRNWGIPEADILFFLNDQATFAEITEVIEELAQREGDFKFVFYFCGHGYRTSPPLPTSYLLFHDSQMDENLCQNSMTLDYLIQLLNKCNCTAFYIFIDSCHLRINTIIHPNLKMEIDGATHISKSFFCLLSSGIEPSFEDVEGEYGYFTDSLLRSLAAIRLKGCSPAWLIRTIWNLMEEKGLPLPEMYNIGTQKIDFFTSAIPFLRFAVRASFQDFLIQNRNKVLCITGERGIGKTTFCRLLESNEYKTSWIEIDQLRDEEEALCMALREKFTHLFPISSPLPSLENTLKAISGKEPYHLLLIEGFQFKHARVFNHILSILSNLPLQVVFTSIHSPKYLVDQNQRQYFQEWELPAFNYDETKQLIHSIQTGIREKDCEMIFLASRGNPLKIQKGLKQHPLAGATDWEKEEVRKAIRAIYSCGLYVNEDLFCRVFGLDIHSLRNLEDIGLISQSAGCWYPHEILNEIAESENYESDPRLSLEYWYQQTDELPSHKEAAKSLIITLSCLDYENRADNHLTRAIHLLSREGAANLPYLIDGAEIYLKNSTLTKSAIYLADSLLSFGKWDIAKKILEIPPAEPNLKNLIKVSYAQCLWKSGNYLGAIDLATELIEKKRDHPFLLQAFFHRGISYFLLGEWEEAKKDFLYLVKKTSDPIYLGFAKCMLGTVLGLRGIDIPKAKELLQGGINLLLQSPDQSVAWVGWNNLGELFWKTGDFRLSSFHLQRALEIATHSENANMKVESIRNLLQLHWRSGGPLSKEVNELLALCENIDITTLEHSAKIQILNTLATIYLMRGEDHRAPLLIKQVIPLTINNNEYHIYTLSNLALLFKARGKEDKAYLHFKRAMDQAKSVGNSLALQQIQYDFAFYGN